MGPKAGHITAKSGKKTPETQTRRKKRGDLVNAVTITADCMAVLICCIVLFVQLSEVRLHDRVNRSFNILFIVLVAALLIDLASWVTERPEVPLSVLWTVSFLSCISGAFVATAYVNYAYHYAKTVCEISPVYLRLGLILGGIALLLNIVLAAMGRYFVIDGYFFAAGEAYGLCIGINYSPAILVPVMFIRYRRELTLRAKISTLCFFLLPILAELVQGLAPTIDLDITFASCALGFLAMYMVVQGYEYRGSALREQIMREISRTDTLTRLPNRLCYTETLDRLVGEGEDAMLGVLFCDVNGLKRVNDTQGHSAGDMLLIRFADLLRSVFEEEQIYRISGDEYVVLLHGALTQEDFDKKLSALRELAARNQQIASIGDAFGQANRAEHLVGEAETRMYIEKTAYHLHNPR